MPIYYRPSVKTFYCIVIISCFFVGLANNEVYGQSAAQIDRMEKQIRAMQIELKKMKKLQAQREKELKEIKRQAAITANRNNATKSSLPNSNVITTTMADGSVVYSTNEKPSNRPLLTFGTTDYHREPTAYARITGTPVPLSASQSEDGFHKGQFNIGRISITLGGFFETAGFYRTRNETADISSNWNSIPWKNNPNAHTNEFHMSERQSRISALVGADVTKAISVSGYTEIDFQGAGSSSNSRQSNSYVPRVRVLYGEIENRDDDYYIMGGQSWSLATLFKKGMAVRHEQVPLVIDAQYVPGFTWTRNTGVRFVKGFDNHKYHVGIAFENPQSIWGGTAYIPHGHIITNNTPGGQVNNPSTTYSTDVAPDIILKVSADPKLGHFESFGMLRFVHNRVSHIGGGQSHTAVAGGGGGGMVIPVIKDEIEFQASGMAGYGIGRYGVSNLADATNKKDGSPALLPEAQTLVGLIGYPTKQIDVYAYGGMEQILSRSGYEVNGKPYGYGNIHADVSGCQIENAPSTMPCNANIRRVAQGAVGFWWRYLQSDYGTLSAGAQFSHTDVVGFSGTGGRPHTDDNMAFFSLRYLPFQ